MKTFADKIQAQIDRNPKLHPSHPYSVLITFKSNGVIKKDSYIVGAYSKRRAELFAIKIAKVDFRKKGKVIDISSSPLMPVELNQYWDSVNTANPEGLKLSVYKEYLKYLGETSFEQKMGVQECLQLSK